MNLLVMSSTFPGAALDGSRPRFVYDLAEALSAHANVTALVPHHPGALKRERMGGVDVVRFQYWWPASAQSLTPNMREQMARSVLARLQVPAFLFCQIAALRRLLSRSSVDTVNAHWLVPQGLTAAIVRGTRRRRFRLALHVHAGDVYLLSRVPGGGMIARFVLTRTDLVFADGSHVRDTLDELLGYPSGAELQPMGVDRKLFETRAHEEPAEARDFAQGYILFVGRFVAKKGAVYLIRAMAKLRESQPHLGLLLIGSGPEEAALQEEARRLRLGTIVRFVGARDHKEIVRYLQHSRLVVVPSIVDDRGETEGMPTVVTEALTAGTLVIGSNVNGIPDLIRHGKNGWLCRQRDPDHIASTIDLALRSADRQRVIDQGRRTARALDWRALARRYHERLESS